MLCIDLNVKTAAKHILGGHLKSSKIEGPSKEVVSNVKMKITGLQCMWKKETGHSIDWEKKSILDSDKIDKSRKEKESMYYINS